MVPRHPVLLVVDDLRLRRPALGGLLLLVLAGLLAAAAVRSAALLAVAAAGLAAVVGAAWWSPGCFARDALAARRVDPVSLRRNEQRLGPGRARLAALAGLHEREIAVRRRDLDPVDAAAIRDRVARLRADLVAADRAVLAAVAGVPPAVDFAGLADAETDAAVALHGDWFRQAVDDLVVRAAWADVEP